MRGLVGEVAEAATGTAEGRGGDCLHRSTPGCAGRPPGQTDPVKHLAGGCSLGRVQQVTLNM